MMWTLAVVTAPAAEPVSLAEAKRHLNIEWSEDDTYITALITAAREIFEAFTGRGLITQTWDLVLDEFPVGDAIEVPLPPLQSVTYVKYYDADNTLQTVSSDDYLVITDRNGGSVQRKETVSWPSPVYTRRDAVQVRFVAGYGDAADVPQGAKQAISLVTGTLFANREEVVVGSVVNDNPSLKRAMMKYRVRL